MARPRVYDLMVTVSLPPPRSALVTLALAAALASPAALAGDDLNGSLRRVTLREEEGDWRILEMLTSH